MNEVIIQLILFYRRDEHQCESKFNDWNFE